MKLRRFVRAMILGLGLLVAPLVAEVRTEAQPPGKVWRIGYLGGGSPATR